MENAARTIRWVELPKISNAFQNAHNKLSSGSVLSDHDSLLPLLTKPFLASKFHELQSSANYNRRSQYLDIGAIEQQFENAVVEIVRFSEHIKNYGIVWVLPSQPNFGDYGSGTL
ncbi:hypothetical protein ZIOFF_054494 [Zingiber officinale]|uniref:Uncharacterized protein n=1 Tax=Zingiber officinale TaxID=94328 RepID=A0A8J5KDQ7_ZINOF|nr:hypothetical protein ZIOFF_054494 [Zingiber officinale]